MRIALDSTPLTLTSGGLARYVSDLSCSLASEFPEDEYFLLSDQPFAMPPGAPPNLRRGRGAHSPAERRWWLWGVNKAIAENSIDVFHGTNFEVPYRRKIPAVLTIHDLSPWRDKEWHADARRVRQRAPWLLRLGRANIVLTVSEAIRREVIARFNVLPSRVRAVPLAASALFRPVERSAPALGARPFFLMIATLEPRKNIAGLVAAWRQSRAETGADLVIAGRSRPDFAGITPCEGLHLPGEVADEELPRLYSDALAFVYPTHYEGFGLPVLEAMQCGCPVITSLDPAVTEVSGDAAIHVGSIEEIAQAMRAVAASPEWRGRLREAGLRRAAAFSWQRTARETRAIYAELAGFPVSHEETPPA